MLRKLSAAIVALLGTAWTHAALADWELNMPRGVTEISEEIYGLHMLIFGVCVVIAIVVFGAMFYSIFAHRKSLGVTPATFSHSTKAEIIWTVIPIIILVAMAVPAAETMVRLEDSRNSDMSIKITGYQWKWRYDYIDEGFGFYSTSRSRATWRASSARASIRTPSRTTCSTWTIPSSSPSTPRFGS
jgi:cytochrome c oxidase subunit 2